MKHFVIRYYKGSYNYFDQPFDSGVLEALTVCIPIIWYREYSWEGMVYGGIAGCLMLLGRIFIAFGIAEGLAGPAQSIMATNAMWLTILTVIFDGQKLSILQFMGIFSGILGAFIIALGDNFVEKLSKLVSKKEQITKVMDVE
jgi:drug/metabolite transporter (DMT)-like permease